MLAIEDATNSLVGNILTTKSVKLQTEYIGTRKTGVTLQGMSLYITESHLGFIFAGFGEVADVSSVKITTGIATGGNFEVMVTLTKKHFMDIPNILTCGRRSIYAVVEGGRHLRKSFKILPRKEADTKNPTIYK